MEILALFCSSWALRKIFCISHRCFLFNFEFVPFFYVWFKQVGLYKDDESEFHQVANGFRDSVGFG